MEHHKPLKKLAALAVAALQACAPSHKPPQTPKDECVSASKVNSLPKSSPNPELDEDICDDAPPIQAPPPGYGNKVVDIKPTPQDITIAGSDKGGRAL